MASEELSLQIFFGSQTGCAHEVADYIEYDAHRRGMTSVVRSLEGVTPQDVAACPGFVVFVVSTCGEGEVPDNMKVFWRMLRNRNLPNNLLKEKKVGVFGLGDSGYSKFNYSAKLLYRRLELLGAVFMTGRGDGDDRHPLGLEACLDPWLNDLWTFIEKASGRSYVVSHLGAAPKARVEVTVSSMRGVLNTKPPTCTTIEKADSTTLPYSLLNPCTSALVSNRRITAPEWEQDVRHCVLNVSGKSISHAPGDVVCILPVNSEDKVKHFLNHVGLDGDLVLTSLTSKDGRWDHVPLPISMFDFCLRYLDFDGCPRGRTFFLMLSYFTTSEIEKEKLDFFATAEGQSALRLYSLKEKRSYTEILEDFRHVHLPLNYLFSIIPPLKARSFSIASSLTLHPEELHVCVAVVEFLTPLKRKRYGLCSNWLASVTLQEEENNHRQDGGNAKETTGMPLSLRPSFPVRIWIEKGSIRYPSEDACDIIMVGPGTGISKLNFHAYRNMRGSLKWR